MKSKGEIFGVDEILKDFRELDKRITKASQRKVREGTNYMARKLRAAVPNRDGKKDTGNLKKGIKAEVRGLDASVVAKAPAHHFHIVEYGTEGRYHKKTGKYVGKVEPSYFARNTINTELPKVQQMIIDGVDEVMKGDY